MIRLPSLFSDHVVLQREKPIKIWGWEEAPGTSVSVSLAGHAVETIAGPDGRFAATLPPMPAGGPHELRVAGSSTRCVHDVMVGEVWVCSGQSNMEWPVGSSLNAEAEIATASHPGIRLFTVPKQTLLAPADDVPSRWEVCAPATVREFTAIGYFFGRELSRELDVPIGLINTSWGGTRIETWLSREALETDPLCRTELEHYKAYLGSPQSLAYADWFARLPGDNNERERRIVRPNPDNEGFPLGWASLACDDTAWPAMDTPSRWQDYGYDFSGVLWFRKTVEIPAAWAGQDLALDLGACDKHDTAYFNGEPVGVTGWETPGPWTVLRHYRVPGRLVKAGRAVLAVRIYSYLWHGGLIGPADQMRLRPAGNDKATPICLHGPWRYRIEHNFGRIEPPMCPPLGPGNANSPHILFDSMIAPLVPFPVRGAIWYQGESNADHPHHYRSLLPLLIADWRRGWQQDDFAFLIVQLANYMTPAMTPGSSLWAELREAQALALALPHTGMAVAIDIGDELDIHPKNKQEVGRRLALAALAGTYGRKLECSGPVYKSMTIEGNKAHLEFTHLGGGLVAGAPATKDAPPAGSQLRQFAIAGEDKVFVWANARIDGDTVVVWSPDVPRPVAVRYAFADNPAGCNLCNRAGLLAGPFRTDDG